MIPSRDDGSAEPCLQVGWRCMLPASDEAGVPQQGGIFPDQFRSHVGPSGFPANKVTEVRTIIDPMNSDRHSYADKDKRIMAAVARHVTSIVEGKATSNVVALR